MDDVLTRIFTDLVGRLSGPLTLRLYLQPLMASAFGLRDGLKRARNMRPRLRDIGKVIVAAIVLDVVYELIVFRRLYPAETIDVAVILAVVPYVIVRGVTTWLARRRRVGV